MRRSLVTGIPRWGKAAFMLVLGASLIALFDAMEIGASFPSGGAATPANAYAQSVRRSIEEKPAAVQGKALPLKVIDNKQPTAAIPPAQSSSKKEEETTQPKTAAASPAAVEKPAAAAEKAADKAAAKPAEEKPASKPAADQQPATPSPSSSPVSAAAVSAEGTLNYDEIVKSARAAATDLRPGRAGEALKLQSPTPKSYPRLYTHVNGTSGRLAPQPEGTLPDACYNGLGWAKREDAVCYFEVAQAQAQAQAQAADPHANLCWGYSGRKNNEEPLLFHAMVLTGFGSQMPLFIWSFLATQCCDAVLNVWLGPKAFSNSARAAMDIPTHHAHRIVYRLYDGAKEWASVKEDFSAHNQTAVDAMTSMPDLRFHSDWARMIIMYNYGGTWFDLDTVYLRDLRMVTAFQPFLYRAGALILPNNAVFRLGKRPNELSRRIIDSVLTGGHPGPIPVFYNLGMSAMGSATGVKYLAEALFDFSWIRFAESECAAMKEVHPELVKQRQGGDNWDAFFTRHARDDAELDAWRSSSFMPGSLTYHWHMSFSDHNRHLEGLPPRSWAGVLLQRYQALALEKTICAPVPAP